MSMMQFICAAALAGSVPPLTRFTSGTPVKASEVNDNFVAVKTTADDNYTRLNNVDSRLAVVESAKQNRVSGSCVVGSAITSVAADGSVTCAANSPDARFGTNTSLAAPGKTDCTLGQVFPVATRFDLELYPHRPAIQTFVASFELDKAPIIAKWLPAAIGALHPTVEVACNIGPVDDSGKSLIMIAGVAFGGTQVEASKRIDAMRSLPSQAKPIDQVIDGPAIFNDVFQNCDAGFPANKRMYGDQLWSDASMGDLITTTYRLAEHAPAAPSAITIVSCGGNGRIPYAPPSSGQASLPKGSGKFIGAYAFWDDAAQDDANLAWAQSVMKAAEPYGAGRDVGEADLSINSKRVQECFSDEAWDRLIALKKKFDPNNVFYSYLTT